MKAGCSVAPVTPVYSYEETGGKDSRAPQGQHNIAKQQRPVLNKVRTDMGDCPLISVCVLWQAHTGLIYMHKHTHTAYIQMF